MAHLPPASLDHLRRRHGVASRDQLLAIGVSRHTIRELCSAGHLVAVLHGVYRHRLVPFDDLARCAAVCSSHPEAVISGAAAGRLWKFRRLPDDRRTHALFPPASQPTVAPWVVPYRTRAFRAEDVVRRPDGIVVTTRARTAFDLARHLGSDNLLSVMEQAMHDGRSGPDELWAVAEPWLSPNRPWARRFVALLSRRVQGGAAESHPEVIVGSALVEAGVRGLRRQFRVDLPGYGRARFDLAVPELRWAIEVDAYPTHRETVGASADRERDRAATRLGWQVSRVGPDGLGSNLRGTAASLAAHHGLLRGARAPDAR